MCHVGASTLDRAVEFLIPNCREVKPRRRAITEIRGPYYSPVGPAYLRDLLDVMGAYVDTFKFAGGSFAVMPKHAVARLIEICHDHDVAVSTGGFIERALTLGPQAVARYIDECKALGFDIIEVSSGFLCIPADDLVRVVEKVQQAGLKAKPEVGIQYGAGGDTASRELAAEGVRDPGWAIYLAKRYLDAGAYMIMIESEGITENVETWRTDIPARFRKQPSASPTGPAPTTRTWTGKAARSRPESVPTLPSPLESATSVRRGPGRAPKGRARPGCRSRAFRKCGECGP